MSLVWINGHLVDKADAKVSPFDHGFLYGDGVWEPLRVFHGKPFRLAEHLRNFVQFAECQGIDIPISREELIEAIGTTVRANGRVEGYVRVILSRGPGTLGPDPRKIDPTVIIMAEEYLPFPPQLYLHGLHALTCAGPRQDARLLGQPHLVRAKHTALAGGCLEAVLRYGDGRLGGTTEGMLFLVKDGAVIVAGDHLPDATGYAVATMAGESGRVVVEQGVSADDLFGADEVFQVGTSCGVIAVVRIDGREIGGGTEGPITRQLRERYLAVTRGGG